MDLAGTIAASAACLFVSLVFSGPLNFVHGGVSIVCFIVVLVGFGKFIDWAVSLESY